MKIKVEIPKGTKYFDQKANAVLETTRKMSINGFMTGHAMDGGRTTPFQMHILKEGIVDAAFELLDPHIVSKQKTAIGRTWFSAGVANLDGAIMWGSNQRGWKFTCSDFVTIFPKA